MVIGGAFCDGRDDGDVVTFGADIVCRGNDGDIDVCYTLGFVLATRVGFGHTVFTTNLALWNNQLQRVRIVSVVEGVVQDADCLQKMSSSSDLAWEVRRIGQDLGALGLELHAIPILTRYLHSCFDTNSLSTFVEHFVYVSVEHVCSTIDGRQASEALWQLSEAV